MAEQPHDFAHRLAGLLVGNAVNHDDGDAVGLVHRRVRIRRECPMPPSQKEMAEESTGGRLVARMIGEL
jgi:hypothetical protein